MVSVVLQPWQELIEEAFLIRKGLEMKRKINDLSQKYF
jgi:hypothetical protein